MAVARPVDLAADEHARTPMTSEVGSSHGESVDERSTRLRIEQAALALFYAKGYAGSSIRPIASAADVATATLFHYFPTKHALLKAILDRAIDDLQGELDEALAGVDDPRERLRVALTVLIVQHCERTASSFVAQSELRSLEPDEAERIRQKRVRVQEIFDDAVSDGVANGTFHSAFPREASRAILNMGTQVATWYRSTGPLSPAEIAEMYCEFAERLLGFIPPPAREQRRS